MKIIRHFGLQLLILANCMFLLLSVMPVFGLQQVAVHDNYSNYTDLSGNLHIVGEVENLGSVDAKFVKVTADCYNSSDDIFDAKDTFTTLSIVPPNRRAPFHLIISPAVANKISRYSLSVTGQNISEPLSRSMLVLSHNSYMESAYLKVVGEVQNDGTQVAHSTKVVTTCYDTNGRVVAVGSTYTYPRDLNAGQKCSFKISIDSQRSAFVTRYEVQVESSEAIMIPEFSSIILVIVSACFLALLLTMKRATRGSENRLFLATL